VVATLIAVYGAWLVTPLGWEYAGIVWGYAFAWFLVTDPLKLLAYKVLDTVKSEAKPEVKAEPKAEAKAEPEPNPEQTTKPAEAKSEARPDVKAEANIPKKIHSLAASSRVIDHPFEIVP
jgi:H+-transporting ATPase